jgi:hypothetical protein
VSGQDPFSDPEARLDTHGPFAASRRRFVLFSAGNDRQDYGPVMAPGSDTFFARAFCSTAARRTGIRYLAHVPFTIDPSSDSLIHLCPEALLEEEFFGVTADYCATLLDAAKPRPEGVCIHIPWHGQQIMAERIDGFARRLSVGKAHLMADIVVETLRRFW